MLSATLKAKAAKLVEEGKDEEAKLAVDLERAQWKEAAYLLREAEREVLDVAQVAVSPSRVIFVEACIFAQRCRARRS